MHDLRHKQKSQSYRLIPDNRHHRPSTIISSPSASMIINNASVNDMPPLIPDIDDTIEINNNVSNINNNNPKNDTDHTINNARNNDNPIIIIDDNTQNIR